MIRAFVLVALAGFVLAIRPASAQQGPSPEQINQAIDQGVAYLKRTQSPDGAWTYAGHELGMTALGGLALFESKIPRDDPAIVRADEYVRRRAPTETQTYDLGLSILFLSRLYPDDRGEVRDLIRQMAWKLAAGQQGGAWSYGNPSHPPFPLPILERSAPPTGESGGTPAAESGGQPAAESGGTPAAESGGQPAAGSGREGPSVSGLGGVAAGASSPPATASKVNDGEAGKGREPDKKPGDQPPDDSPAPEKPSTKQKPQPGKKPTVSKNNAKRPNPRAEARARQNQIAVMRAFGDHSNTQLGMLGVWVAGQYGYDSRSVLTNLGERFHLCQRADGAWGYRADGSVVHGPEAMTCVGLLAVYLAAGNDTGDGRDALSRGQELEQDRTYRRGLEAVTSYAKKINRSSPTYFLWSLERLCVALGKETLDGFDWYKAGAQVLVDRQALDGSWNDGQWGQAPDTCLALLFLHRSNLARGIEREVRLAEYKDISGLPTVARRVDPPAGSAEPPGPEPGPPIVATPGSITDAQADRDSENVAIVGPTPPPRSEPGDDQARTEDPSVAETGGDSVPFATRLPIVVAVALLVLMALPALTGRWQAEP